METNVIRKPELLIFSSLFETKILQEFQICNFSLSEAKISAGTLPLFHLMVTLENQECVSYPNKGSPLLLHSIIIKSESRRALIFCYFKEQNRRKATSHQRILSSLFPQGLSSIYCIFNSLTWKYNEKKLMHDQCRSN